MKILVTGGSGFIGSSVIRRAIASGHGIVNVDALTYASCPDNLASVEEHPNYHFEHEDIRNRDALDAVFKKHMPDGVMHIAAESHVDRSINGPADFIQTNIVGTFNMLEAARSFWETHGRNGGFRFHHVSTDEVYGCLPNDPNILFTEDTPYAPRSPYSASKASSDHLARAWHETYGLPVIITNCSNNYGPYQFPEKLVPVIIVNALENKPLPIYGDGGNIRDWLYVEDHTDALFLVMQKGQIGRSYNIGGNNERTNLQLATTLCRILDRLRPRESGLYEELISFVPDRPGHDTRYAIDAERVKCELGWEPTVSVENGLEKTVTWYLNNETWWQPLLGRKGSGKRTRKQQK